MTSIFVYMNRIGACAHFYHTWICAFSHDICMRFFGLFKCCFCFTPSFWFISPNIKLIYILWKIKSTTTMKLPIKYAPFYLFIYVYMCVCIHNPIHTQRTTHKLLDNNIQIEFQCIVRHFRFRIIFLILFIFNYFMFTFQLKFLFNLLFSLTILPQFFCLQFTCFFSLFYFSLYCLYH